MASGVSLQTIGNWNKEVGVGLDAALAVSMDVSGRTGEQACRHALILMAQSAKKLATNRKKKRKIKRDEHGQYVETWTQARRTFYKVYKWMFNGSKQDRIPGTWDNARTIGNHGLAGRSWMWGLGKLGAKKAGAKISGTSRVASIRHDKLSGYIKENTLSYILKAMPAGWERTVERLATNKIMNAAKRKLEAKWRRQVGAPKGVKLSNKGIADYFKANP